MSTSSAISANSWARRLHKTRDFNQLYNTYKCSEMSRVSNRADKAKITHFDTGWAPVDLSGWEEGGGFLSTVCSSTTDEAKLSMADLTISKQANKTS